MTTVRDLLRSKGEIWSTSPETSVYEALQLMAEKNVGALLVINADQKLVGIFSERDYARKVILKGKFSKETQVREVMTEKVIRIDPNQSIEFCMLIMTEKRIRHLPVFEDDRLMGVVSIGDVVKGIISDQQFTIAQLEDYIVGRR